MDLEISKMLTISTDHIKQETYKLLETHCEDDCELPVYYKKDGYGYFIFCGKDYMNDLLNEKTFNGLPHDLLMCMMQTYILDCDWLCLDCDGKVVNELRTYEW